MRSPWFLALLVGGCTNEIELPSAPNMRAVVQRFEVVDGTLDAESAPLLLQASAVKLGYLGDVDQLVEVLTGLTTGLDNLDETDARLEVRHQGLQAGGVQIDPGAWAVYHRACPGSGAEARSDRGSLDLTLLFEGTAINPVIWGGMKSCLLGAALRLDGEVRFYVPNLTQGLTRLIVDFAGQLSQDGDPWTQVAFDALITPGEGVLTTVDVEGRGRFLVGYGFGTSGVQVVDAQGTWQCGTDTCTGPDGARVPW
ncbi:MAG: hypothetical protein R3F43_33105 [bacterium]